MDSEHRDKKRTNVEQGDRLSSLPDDLIHKILSFTGLKRAIEMSVLSSRWRFIWTSIPYLNFSTEDLYFHMFPKFSKFVSNVFSRRNNQIQVSSLELSFRGKATQVFVNDILNYAFSHNVQQLTVKCFYDNMTMEFPLSLFRSQSLKHLILTGYNHMDFLTLTSTWALPALTTLYLDSIPSYDEKIDLFSNCPNLTNLTLNCCRTRGMNDFTICHSRLSNLTLIFILFNVYVKAPQLKNLSVKQYDCYRCLHLSEDVHSLEKVDLCIISPYNALNIVALLQYFPSVKFLTLNMEIVELLSSSVKLISHQPSPFANLKNLKIYPATKISENDPPKKVNISTEAKKYLLDRSPDATFTMVSRKEIIDMKNAKLAQKDMANFRGWLEREKSEIKSSMAFMEEERKKAQMESHNTKRLKQVKIRSKYLVEIEEKLLQDDKRIMDINGCWKDLNWQIEKGNRKTCDIISKLHDITEILIKLPTSTRAEMQECFASLCEEADVVVNKILDHMKIQCDMKRSDFSVHFNNIAST